MSTPKIPETPPPTSPPLPRKKPSTGFLIFFNALLYFATSFLDEPGDIGLYVIFALIAFVFFFLFSFVVQGIVLLIERRHRFRASIRTLLFVWPGILCLALSFIPGTQKPNQRSPSLSPSGHFEVTVDTRDRTWNFHIKDLSTKKVSDFPTNFYARFNSYWMWDKEDRLWASNSDDGTVCYFSRKGMEWTMTTWQGLIPKAPGVKPKSDPSGLVPPRGLDDD